jgi:hypothetical protein
MKRTAPLRAAIPINPHSEQRSIMITGSISAVDFCSLDLFHDPAWLHRKHFAQTCS